MSQGPFALASWAIGKKQVLTELVRMTDLLATQGLDPRIGEGADAHGKPYTATSNSFYL